MPEKVLVSLGFLIYFTPKKNNYLDVSDTIQILALVKTNAGIAFFCQIFQFQIGSASHFIVTHTDDNVGGASHLRLLNGLRPDPSLG